MEALSGFIGAGLGALIAGLSIYFSDQRKANFEKEKAKRDLLLGKYELIYNELRQLKNYGHVVGMQLLGEVGFGSKFDANNIRIDLSNNNLNMAINFYAPELKQELSEIEATHNSLSEALGQFVLKEDPAEKQKATGKVIQSAQKLEKLSQKLTDILADKVENIVNA